MDSRGKPNNHDWDDSTTPEGGWLFNPNDFDLSTLENEHLTAEAEVQSENERADNLSDQCGQLKLEKQEASIALDQARNLVASARQAASIAASEASKASQICIQAEEGIVVLIVLSFQHKLI